MIAKNMYLLLILSLFIFSCSDNTSDIIDIEETVVNNTELDDKTTLYGVITDIQEKPVAGIVVTDGFSCTLTDKNGVYQLVRHKKAKFVYYSTPSDCKIIVDGDNYPKFFEKLTSKDKKIRHDFTVEKQAVENEFTLFCIADPQCRTSNHVTRYQNETILDINQTAGKYKNTYAMTLGDIIWDSPELWNAVKATMANQSMPFFQTIGNHDHLETADNHDKSIEHFQDMFGPTDYSFNRGNVHIVSMNDMIFTGKQKFTFGFTVNQREWLRQDLSHIPKNKMIILCCHVPFRQSQADFKEVLELLSPFAEAHIMVGHQHFQVNKFHHVNGKSIYEHVHGAACGGWWNSNICSDGTPNGYAIYEIAGNTMSNWIYKATRYDNDFQIRAYDASQEFGPANKRTYSFGYNLRLAGDGWIVANVWNSDTNWKVELYQNGSKVSDMQRLSSWDLWALYYHLEELNKAIASDFDKITDHFYVGQLTGPAASANFEVVATDPFGNRYSVTELKKDLAYIGSYP